MKSADDKKSMKGFPACKELIDNWMFSLQPEDSNGQLDYRYDEFGFKVEEEGKWLFSSNLKPMF